MKHSGDLRQSYRKSTNVNTITYLCSSKSTHKKTNEKPPPDCSIVLVSVNPASDVRKQPLNKVMGIRALNIANEAVDA